MQAVKSLMVKHRLKAVQVLGSDVPFRKLVILTSPPNSYFRAFVLGGSRPWRSMKECLCYGCSRAKDDPSGDEVRRERCGVSNRGLEKCFRGHCQKKRA